MTRNTLRAFLVLLMASGSARAQEPFKAEVIERGKKATALVQTGVLWEGSAFCIDQTGLFVTTARVVHKALDVNAEIKLVLDTGSASERSLRASCYVAMTTSTLPCSRSTAGWPQRISRMSVTSWAHWPGRSGALDSPLWSWARTAI